MSSVGYPTGGKRPGTAYAAAQAAKARRQMFIVGALCVLLVGVLIYEEPTFAKLFKSSNSPAPSTPVATVPAQTQDTQKALAVIRRAPASDPFSGRVSVNGASAVRNVPTPPGARDPFASPPGPKTSAAAPAAAAPLPEQIVIGTPGGNRVARHGWIVILASIPTSQGEGSATRFAANARQNGVSQVSVLNSSNRQPLRGGYWVVYTGPFTSLSDVSARASQVHSHGYATAYIRELIVYS
jgi:hypothetical protein